MEPRRTIAAFGLVLFLAALFGGIAIRSFQMDEEAARGEYVAVPENNGAFTDTQTMTSQRLEPSTKIPVKLEAASWVESGNIEVVFYGGNPNCYQYEAEVTKQSGAAVVKVYSGQVTVSAENRVCTAEARLYSMPVPMPDQLRYADLPIHDGNTKAF